jgi:hypothetical protein
MQISPKDDTSATRSPSTPDLVVAFKERGGQEFQLKHQVTLPDISTRPFRCRTQRVGFDKRVAIQFRQKCPGRSLDKAIEGVVVINSLPNRN